MEKRSFGFLIEAGILTNRDIEYNNKKLKRKSIGRTTDDITIDERVLYNRTNKNSFSNKLKNMFK